MQKRNTEATAVASTSTLHVDGWCT